MATVKFRKRAELVEYTERNPGAMAAQFLLAVFEKVHSTPAKNERQLYGLDVSKWAKELTTLTEKRNQREVQSLALVLQKMGGDAIPEAMDVAVQRSKSILIAKGPKGSWEKGASLELLPSADGGVTLPSEVALAGVA